LNVTAGEECDDANTNGGDGCSSDCQIEEPLPECLIPFDPWDCPDTSVVCGASFAGGDGCQSAGLCAETPPHAYRLLPGPPVVITLAGDLNTLSLMFSGYAGSLGEMWFFDADGLPVDAPLYTNGDCQYGTPPLQPVTFSRPVRTIEVTAIGGQVWIDSFHVNPP
jgi:cysteine-rich repeat protein